MLMHPDLFSFDLRHQVRETYRFLYTYEASESDIDEILQTSLNGGSAGYDVFTRR